MVPQGETVDGATIFISCFSFLLVLSSAAEDAKEDISKRVRYIILFVRFVRPKKEYEEKKSSAKKSIFPPGRALTVLCVAITHLSLCVSKRASLSLSLSFLTKIYL